MFALLAILAICGTAGRLAAEEPLGPPRVCVGFDPELKLWGDREALRGNGLCPKDYAVIAAVSFGASKWDAAERVPVLSTCCPLPKGILTEEHSYAPDRCPEDTVATGSIYFTTEDLPGEERPKIFLRCTGIDRSRFELGPPRSALRLEVYQERIGRFGSVFTSWYSRNAFVPRFNYSHIPVAARYAVGRVSVGQWQSNSYVGQPFGAILSAKLGKYPSDFWFREILYRRKDPGETPRRVAIFPECRAIDDPFSPDARCVP